jgi:hypothetical protein
VLLCLEYHKRNSNYPEMLSAVSFKRMAQLSKSTSSFSSQLPISRSENLKIVSLSSTSSILISKTIGSSARSFGGGHERKENKFDDGITSWFHPKDNRWEDYPYMKREIDEYGDERPNETTVNLQKYCHSKPHRSDFYGLLFSLFFYLSVLL